MYSVAFPKMFASNRTLLNEGHEATSTNLYLLLNSMKTSLFGDPYFGTNLKRFIYEQNDAILRDLIIDDIYDAIRIFMPQLQLTRNNISVESDGTNVWANIDCLNLLDYQTDLYRIILTTEDYEGEEISL